MSKVDTFAKRFRKILQLRNYTQKEISEKSGLLPSAINQYLSSLFLIFLLIF